MIRYSPEVGAFHIYLAGLGVELSPAEVIDVVGWLSSAPDHPGHITVAQLVNGRLEIVDCVERICYGK